MDPSHPDRTSQRQAQSPRPRTFSNASSSSLASNATSSSSAASGAAPPPAGTSPPSSTSVFSYQQAPPTGVQSPLAQRRRLNSFGHGRRYPSQSSLLSNVTNFGDDASPPPTAAPNVSNRDIKVDEEEEEESNVADNEREDPQSGGQVDPHATIRERRTSNTSNASGTSRRASILPSSPSSPFYTTRPTRTESDPIVQQRNRKTSSSAQSSADGSSFNVRVAPRSALVGANMATSSGSSYTSQGSPPNASSSNPGENRNALSILTDSPRRSATPALSYQSGPSSASSSSSPPSSFTTGPPSGAGSGSLPQAASSSQANLSAATRSLPSSPPAAYPISYATQPITISGTSPSFTGQASTISPGSSGSSNNGNFGGPSGIGLGPISGSTGGAGSSAAQRISSSTPFLPSPLAQASLAPGEEDGEQIEGLELNLEDRGNERSTARSSEQSLLGSASGGLRRSGSVPMGYKSPPSRRRISTTSHASPPSIPASLPGVGTAGPSSSKSASGTVLSPPSSGLGLSRAASVASASSPQGIRRPASLLSISKEAGLAASANSLSTAAMSGEGGVRQAVRHHSSADSTSGASNSADTPGSSPTSSLASQYGSTASAQNSPRSSPTQSLSKSTSGAYSTGVRSSYQFPPAPPSLQEAQASASSPPNALPLSQPRTIVGGSRGTHGRSESMSSAISMPMRGGESFSSSLSMASLSSSPPYSSSPSIATRAFPSAPPLAPLSMSSAGSPPNASAFSPPGGSSGIGGTGTPSYLSPPESHHSGSSLLSPISASSQVGSSASTASGKPVESIRLQRVPTSVRLAQDLHPQLSPAVEKRRISVDFGMSAMPSSGSPRTDSGKAHFRLAGDRSGGSSGTSSDAEKTDKYESDMEGIMSSKLVLPPTPMATRRNTPSPQLGTTSSSSEETAATAHQQQDSAPHHFQRHSRTVTAGRGSPEMQRRSLLSSPFNVIQGSTLTASPANSVLGSHSSSSSSSPRGLAISDQPAESSSAYSPFFPFSIPPTSVPPPAHTSTSSSGGSASRSHSRTRSTTRGSPLLNRLSPRMNQDPFSGAQPGSTPPKGSGLEEGVSPRTAVFPGGISSSRPSLPARAQSQLSPTGSSRSNDPAEATSSPDKRRTFSGMPTPPRQYVPGDTPIRGSGRESGTMSYYCSDIGNIALGGFTSATASPTSASAQRKHFRTSMMPGTNVSSTEEYARHLQESRASKLRKWANPVAGGGEGEQASLGLSSSITFGDVGSATLGGPGFGTARSKKRAGIPDFGGFGHAVSGSGDYRDELGGDLGARPGTAGSREIEWVDWLDEYKKMKEAKIRAEQEAEQARRNRSSMVLTEEDAQAEGAEDLANEMRDMSLAEVSGEDRDDDLSQITPKHTRQSSQAHNRMGSDDKGKGKELPFPEQPDHSASELIAGVTPRPRKMSVSSMVSLSFDPQYRRRSSQELKAANHAAARAQPPPVHPPRVAMPQRAASYAPTSTRPSQQPVQSITPAVAAAQTANPPKKKKNINLGTKIDAWWSAVTKSFLSPSSETGSSQAPAPASPSTGMATTRPAPAALKRPDVPSRSASDTKTNTIGGTVLGPSPPIAKGDGMRLAPPTPLRHSASAENIKTEPLELAIDRRSFGSGQPPKGALAPAATVVTKDQLSASFFPHSRVNSNSSEGVGSNESGSTGRSEFKRRNPHLSLRLDPRFQAAGTAHKLIERSNSALGSTGSSSQSDPALTSPIFKEPRPPHPHSVASRQRLEQTPSLTPGQSPIWDKTPGLVPVSSLNMRMQRSGSKPLALSAEAEAKASPQPNLAPTFSVSHIREHIRHRLTGAKHSCDKELRKIVHGITAYVENDLENERAFIASGHESRQDEMEVIAQDHAAESVPAGTESAADESDAGNDAGDEEDNNASSVAGATTLPQRIPLTRTETGSSSSAAASSHPSRVGSPNAHIQPRRPTGASRGRTSGTSSPRRFSMQGKRYPSGMPPRPSDLAARLEQSLEGDKGMVAPSSQTSSRSTSRSRSPMPPISKSFQQRNASADWYNKRHHHHSAEDDEKQYFLESLQTIVAIAMEIIDTSVSDLTADPSTCAGLIRRVQKVGKRWDDHPSWPLRGWYVQLLLAVAGLSRVSEFWAEERGFWNFGDEGKAGDEDDPIMFVAKATQEEDAGGSAATSSARSRAPSLAQGHGLARVLSRHQDEQYSPHSAMASPLGIDLGVHRVEEESPPNAAMSVIAPPGVSSSPTQQAEDAENLREAVEEVRNATILVELSLDGESFQYISPVWRDVVGLEPSECFGKPISHLLYPDDSMVFIEATKHLQEDDSHTVEAQFRLRVFTENEDSDDQSQPTFENMEGKGMLVRDRLTAQPMHTMWVIRPAVDLSKSASEDGEIQTARPALSNMRAFSEPVTPFPAGTRTLTVQPILCRICDRQIPTWFFEKHNETCNETHRLEDEISDCNDRIGEFREAVSSLLAQLKDKTSGENSPMDSPSLLEYREVRLLPIRFKEGQIQVLEGLLDILMTALDISTPAMSDDNQPIEDQRLLSPNSEDHLSLLNEWQTPACEDPALRRLANDLAGLCREKSSAVNRLRNTIYYVERVRLEWETHAQKLLATVPEEHSESPPPSPAPTVLPEEGRRESHASTLTAIRDGSQQPTPMPEQNAFSPLSLPSALQVPTPSHITRGPSTFPKSPQMALLSPLPVVESSNQALPGLSPATSAKSPVVIPMSPRMPSSMPNRHAKATSIKDFDIIKPISKGAFGAVYLAKKRNTGDYYAIKVLKKADMIAKNQVTNVKAERKIMMTQADSDFAVKLYWTFQSKDYLYLVMEYLNGGDCAALIKVMGCLEEDWTKSYIAEIVLGLEYLHSRGIVHRDLKPDNLLIDSRGHLRLTDFGLSRFGLLGRQARTIQQTAVQPGRRRAHPPMPRRTVSKGGESGNSTPDSQPRASYFGSMFMEESDMMSESSGSESVVDRKRPSSRLLDSPAVSLDSSGSRLVPPTSSPNNKQSASHRFVGTVDYVAPESILGVGVGEGVDWWALGVIAHEFLTAYPPFHAPTPEQVFDNILSRRINWHEDEVEMSPEAKDFIERLLCFDPHQRLGANGADEVKRHPFLQDIDWDSVRTMEASFVPQVADPESTDYFDARGAVAQVFDDDPLLQADEDSADASKLAEASVDGNASLSADVRKIQDRSETVPQDFGAFNFKNREVLKQANDDMIKKLRSEQLLPSPSESSSRYGQLARKVMPKSSSIGEGNAGPPSPSTSTTSSIGSGFSRPSAPNTPFTQPTIGARRPSEVQAGGRLLPQAAAGEDEEADFSRRNSMPGRLRRASFSNNPNNGQLQDKKVGPAEASWHQRRRTSGYTEHTPASSVSSPASMRAGLPPVPTGHSEQKSSPKMGSSPAQFEKTVDCLIAEDNPISSKILETMLVRLGCLCVVVHNGEEAIRCSMGEIAFDVIFMDMLMPILDGENAARMIKSTKNANQNTPIVAVTSYAPRDQTSITEEGTVFNAVLTKPVNKTDILQVLTKLGFIAKTKHTNTTASGTAPVMTTTLSQSPSQALISQQT